MKYSDFLKNIDKCPFCNLDNREIVEENENAFLTYAVAPYHSDHLLVCPKRHTEYFLDLTPQELDDIDNLQKAGSKILNNLGYTNISFLVREGDGVGKSVKHMHYHIIPDISLGAGDHTGKEREILSEEDITKLIARLKSAI